MGLSRSGGGTESWIIVIGACQRDMVVSIGSVESASGEVAAFLGSAYNPVVAVAKKIRPGARGPAAGPGAAPASRVAAPRASGR